MSNYEDDVMDRDARLTPSRWAAYRAERTGTPVAGMGIGRIVIGTWMPSIFRSLEKVVETVPSQHYGSSRLPVLNGEVEGNSVTLIRYPVGAPATVMHMEELAALGSRSFLAVGAAGALNPELEIGDLVVPNRCLIDEGTSRHYGVTEESKASVVMLEELEQAAISLGTKITVGTVWSIDAPYRELVTDIQRHQKSGVLAVDMETSAMCSLGEARGLSVANVLVVSDDVSSEWNPQFHSDKYEAGLADATTLITTVAKIHSKRD